VTILGKLFRTTAFKLSIAYLVIFSIGTSLVLGGVAWNVNQLLDAQIGQTVEAEITGLAEQYEAGGIRHLVDVIERRARQPGSSLYLVTNYAGQSLAGNVAVLPVGVLDHPGLVETPYQRQTDLQPDHIALARIFLLAGGFRLLVGRDLEERETLRNVMIHALFASLVWLVLFGTMGGLFVATRVLARVDAMNASAKTIMAGDMAGRLPVSGTGDELDRLAQNLNAMIERIGELMAGLREVSDNIAHDLRTPLTRLRNRAEQALRASGDGADGRAALEKIIEEADHLMDVFNALLMIARAEAGTGRDGMAECDVGAVLRDVAELYEPAAEEAALRLDIAVEPNLIVQASRQLLGQALANLLDNALKYGAGEGTGSEGGARESKPICVSARRRGAFVELAVADRGPGILAADRGRVLERFVRLEGARSRPGSGLGLSLSAAIARLHGGQLRLEDNEPGLRVVLALPAAGGPPPALPAPRLRGEAETKALGAPG
jgi:signal transduction histidine kinase